MVGGTTMAEGSIVVPGLQDELGSLAGQIGLVLHQDPVTGGWWLQDTEFLQDS